MFSEWGEDRFVEEYELEEKIPYSELSMRFGGFFTPNYKIVQKNGNYYAYNFTKFSFFDDEYGVYQTQIDHGGFTKEWTFVYRDKEGKYNLVTEYGAHGIIPSEAIFWVAEKHLFLDALREDSKFPTTNIWNSLTKLQSITKAMTKWKTREEKIELVYNWILENISYSTNVSLSDEKIFSWVETYKNKSGVCTGYTKLMLYMLLYAWVNDIEVIKWHVIDAPDFPDIWHAWIRIWEEYFDPTFDDPIWISHTKSREEYKYYSLPKDIFYANRFEYEDLPEVFKTAVDSQINEYIYGYLTKLISKYSGRTHEYKVFSPIIFREEYNIWIHEKLTPELLSQKLWWFTVENNSFRFTEDWKNKRISHIRYYILDDDNTQNVLENLNYQVDDLYLFDWEISDSRREWRLAYEIDIQ